MKAKTKTEPMTLTDQLVAHITSAPAPRTALGAVFKLKDQLKLGTKQEIRPGVFITWPPSLMWRVSDAGNGAIDIAFVGPDYPVVSVPVPIIGSVPADVVGVTIKLDVKAASVALHFSVLPDFTITETFDN